MSLNLDKMRRALAVLKQAKDTRRYRNGQQIAYFPSQQQVDDWISRGGEADLVPPLVEYRG